MAEKNDRIIYWEFMGFLAEGHAQFQKRMRDAPKGSEPMDEGASIRTTMDIRPDEYLILSTYVLQAFDRLGEKGQELRVHVRQFSHDHPVQGGKATPDPVYWELVWQHEIIISNLIADLRKELGPESFKKVDDFVKHGWKGGSTIRARPTSATGQSVVKSAATPAGGEPK